MINRPIEVFSTQSCVLSLQYSLRIRPDSLRDVAELFFREHASDPTIPVVKASPARNHPATRQPRWGVQRQERQSQPLATDAPRAPRDLVTARIAPMPVRDGYAAPLLDVRTLRVLRSHEAAAPHPPPPDTRITRAAHPNTRRAVADEEHPWPRQAARGDRCVFSFPCLLRGGVRCHRGKRATQSHSAGVRKSQRRLRSRCGSGCRTPWTRAGPPSALGGFLSACCS